MKKLLPVFCVLTCITVSAQENVLLTSQLIIEGKVKNHVVFSLKNAKDFTTVSLDSLVIYNHLLERKRVIKNIKGVLLAEILKKAVIDEANPKLLSEYYFTCIAADGYKVVFSWNEIFNSNTGNGIMIVTEAGVKKEMMNDRMVLLSASDYATGRRYMKGIKKVIAERVK